MAAVATVGVPFRRLVSNRQIERRRRYVPRFSNSCDTISTGEADTLISWMTTEETDRPRNFIVNDKRGTHTRIR